MEEIEYRTLIIWARKQNTGKKSRQWSTRFDCRKFYNQCYKYGNELVAGKLGIGEVYAVNKFTIYQTSLFEDRVKIQRRDNEQLPGTSDTLRASTMSSYRRILILYIIMLINRTFVLETVSRFPFPPAP